jgi:hypothetical protein
MWGGDDFDTCRRVLRHWLDECIDQSVPNLFWKIICAEVMCESLSSTGVRRAVLEDELTFVMWALESDNSPLGSSLVGKDIWNEEHAFSDEAIAWAHVCVLWPDASPLAELFLEKTLDDKYYRPVDTTVTAQKMIRMLEIFSGRELGTMAYLYRQGAPLVSEQRDGHSRNDKSWRSFIHDIRTRIIQRYDMDLRQT